MFKQIGLIASQRITNDIRDTLLQVTELLRQRSIDIIFCKGCADVLGDQDLKTRDISEFGDELDLVIAIGGDGTMLNAAKLIRSSNVPLLGINRGTLGFLADLPADNINSDLNKILDGEYVDEERFMLQGKIFRDDKLIVEGEAFNDVVIQKWNSARLVEFDTYINGNFLLTQRSDGMIISTPTGSTAYALSGGGPILNPSLDAILLVPICPHTLTVRPVVVDGDSLLEIIVGTRKVSQAGMTCDGNMIGELQPGDTIRIQKSVETVRLIHPKNHDHFSILRAKLGWGR